MPTPTTHTPGPINHAQIIEGGVYIPTAGIVQSANVRDFIVRACNAHEGLVAALAALEADYANMCDEDDPESDGARLLRQARAALRAAKGE